MRVNTYVQCQDFPCSDMRHAAYQVPGIDLRPEQVSILLISEAAPAIPGDGYYAGAGALFEQTTLLAFNDAGAQVASFHDLLAMGVYLTTAVKCGKTGYAIQTATVQVCSRLLEQELALFPNVQVYLLMGDVAIKAFNAIARRQGLGRVIPAGATYKIRGEAYSYRGRRVFPSYLQAGPSFFIEKSKRKMVADDLATALSLVKPAAAGPPHR